jgi:hypothetical protein
MHFEHNNRRSERVNDEFLRRMIGGELTGRDLPAMRMARLDAEPMPPLDHSPCNQNEENVNPCPTSVKAPSLAMVYSPEQCWRSLLDPDTALKSGSLFAELVMPFEAGRKNNGIGGKLCK